MGFATDVVVIGGCGRVGLPLGIAFADRGLTVGLYDIDGSAVERVGRGQMPFREAGADEALGHALEGGRLSASTNPSMIKDAEHVVITLATDVDLHLNPDIHGFLASVERYAEHFLEGQLLVLRSTLYPGVTVLVEDIVQRLGRRIDVAFCPERIAEGQAMTELFKLPQIVGARTPWALDRAEALFRHLTEEVVRLTPEEAELAKLFSNTWRYAKFAIANQLFMIANDFGVDYETVRSAMAQSYPRAADIPRAGFAAGPCLFKDTMQLASFNNNNFTLGHASMLVNEGLPLYLVSRLSQRYQLSEMTVGILGMAFKGESDDIRSSLSYKLKRVLLVRAVEVLCTDPYVTSDPDLVPLEEVLERADLLIIATPHSVFADLKTRIPVVDIWNLRGSGVRV